MKHAVLPHFSMAISSSSNLLRWRVGTFVRSFAEENETESLDAIDAEVLVPVGSDFWRHGVR